MYNNIDGFYRNNFEWKKLDGREYLWLIFLYGDYRIIVDRYRRGD